MNLNSEKIFVVKDIPQSNPCLKCKTCIRLRLFEMGITPGEKIKFVQKSDNMWILSILGDSEMSVSTIGLRKEEIDRIFFEDDCIISLNETN